MPSSRMLLRRNSVSTKRLSPSIPRSHPADAHRPMGGGGDGGGGEMAIVMVDFATGEQSSRPSVPCSMHRNE